LGNGSACAEFGRNGVRSRSVAGFFTIAWARKSLLRVATIDKRRGQVSRRLARIAWKWSRPKFCLARRDSKSTAAPTVNNGSRVLLSPAVQCWRIIRVARGSADLRYAYDSDRRILCEIKPPRGCTTRMHARSLHAPAMCATNNGAGILHDISTVYLVVYLDSIAFRMCSYLDAHSRSRSRFIVPCVCISVSVWHRGSFNGLETMLP